MNVSAYNAFVAMYHALDAAQDKMDDESLRVYLSDANPFLFRGNGSADPAIYVDFEAAFDKRFERNTNDQESLAFVRDYLQRQNAPVLWFASALSDSRSLILAEHIRTPFPPE